MTAIAAGYVHGLAVSGGNVYTWGSNQYGQLGTTAVDICNSGACNTTAKPVPGLSDVRAVGAGGCHSLAVLNDGTVRAWGINQAGGLDDGTTTQRTTPVQVVGPNKVGVLSGVTAVAGGEGHSLALKDDGTVYAWRQNSQGQLGLGVNNNDAYTSPVQVPGLSGIVAIAAGYRHSLALRNDGVVFAWGENASGQVGNGSLSTNACACTNAPAAVGGIAGATAIGAGNAFSLAVLNDGTVRAWGDNSASQISVPSPEKIATPTVVPGLPNATVVAGGGGHSVALNVTPQLALSVGTDGTGTGTVAPGSGNYNAGATVQLTAQPTGDSVFTGWTVDGAAAGWTNPLTVTMTVSHTIIATFSKAPSFCDVNPGDRYFEAIRQLAARGVIRGFEAADGKLCFAPQEGTKRAQMAALIARPLGWDTEDHGNGFSDRGPVDGDLWRNVGALAFYNVARGYKAETCGALKVAAPCYGPTDEVVYAQVISFITRGMVAKGYWQQQPENPALYPNVPADSGHRQDIATYVHYAGVLPGTSSATQNWSGYDQPAPRAWFAEAEWRALSSYFNLGQP